ncbi:IucA/IucC family C-terminal-domain containing protein [Halobacillus litoralis]|uniref:IucA/IucC family C-terminal-domain containing protein n=1 Tax=Halobacillus litoralis TaxID=45668 RepID=UPI001CFC8AC8|nr:IucA/IucC family C-terminal-domain containing protein [Halobacillus litoralis]
MNTTFEQIQNDHKLYIGSEYQDRISYEVADLIDNKYSTRELLETQMRQLDAPNLTIAGLLFGKMYSVLTMGLFESLVKHDLVIETHPEKIGIELKEKNAMNYIIKEEHVHKATDLPDEKVKEQIYTFITLHLQPLFQTVARVSKCKATHMRSIVSHNLHQRKCALAQTDVDQERLEKVFHWFTSHELFQENRRNPLHFKFRYYKADNGKETYVRRHCCMKYMLHNANKEKCCPTCPLIPDEERDDRIK